MGPAKTHFETIPVETVKKIAHVFAANSGVGDPMNNGSGDQMKETWRAIALRVQAERDPNKMIGLVQQLIETYDEEKVRTGRSVRELK